MGGNMQLTVLLGAMALCTIVGIYYVWVRKLGRPGENPVEPPHSHQPQ